MAMIPACVWAAAQQSMPGVTQPERARINYILKCQGCHTADGRGSPGGSPALKGMVARFLKASGGREYLGRVPGVATAALDDQQLAELLNWTLYTFDSSDLPPTFRPYTAPELHDLRARPLRMDAPIERQKLQDEIKLQMGG